RRPVAHLQQALPHRGEGGGLSARSSRVSYDIGLAGAPRSGGNGTNSSEARSGSFMRPARQSALACSMRSLRDDTKFQSMKRGPTGSPPMATSTDGARAVSIAGLPDAKMPMRPA